MASSEEAQDKSGQQVRGGPKKKATGTDSPADAQHKIDTDAQVKAQLQKNLAQIALEDAIYRAESEAKAANIYVTKANIIRLFLVVVILCGISVIMSLHKVELNYSTVIEWVTVFVIGGAIGLLTQE